MEKYTQKKLRNQLLQTLIGKHVSDKSFERIKECNTFLFMVADKTMEKTKLHRSNNCDNRFCPICAWKKSRKNALKISVLMQYLREEEKKDFVFLTLTAPNVKADELDDEIKHYNKSFQRLMQRKEVKSAVKGYVRKLEVTYNKERDDYHPHFHVILAVNKSYFTDTKAYISRDRWLELWQKSTKNNLITQVDVRKVKATDNKKEVSEIAKYSAKDSDYLEDEKVFDTFYKSLSGKRLIVFSGLFKDASKLYENKELEKYKELDPTQYIYQIFYHWGQQKYLETEKKLMTEDMQKEVNNQMLDEEDFEDE
ncbi:TPA: protein rep [Staphylococcus aureus]|uniref:protein rep n=2 Tax=Bacilli TaxID=91061 RepID=UPI000E224147|nr:protein rep [Staphylococcus pseudintermedius]HBG3196791.1 protein rep [Staphylococcus aureus]REA86321.1 replication protein [Staphylococcus pseudintermedius]HBG3196841.1 protein rep [Staphylococcus aureus]HDY9724119.1 protein rep [Staphylococcus aureus]HDY9724166.1 protein rep [Staphylococcus aureus]